MSKTGRILLLLCVGLVLASLSAMAANQDIHQENLTTQLNLQDAPTITTAVLVEDTDTSVADQLDPTPGTTFEVNCTATVSDEDGEADINSAWAELYQQSVGDAASDDPQNHYTNSACTLDTSVGGANDVGVVCTFNVEFYAVNDTWECNLSANDSVNQEVSGTDTSVMNNLLALDVADGVLDFGTLAVGADTGTSDVSKVITNNGNTDMGIKLNVWGSLQNDQHSMNCTTGYTEPGDLKVSNAASTAYASKTALASSADDGTTYGAFSLARQTSGVTGSTGNLYFGMGVSASGNPTDTCTGNLMFTAIAA